MKLADGRDRRCHQDQVRKRNVEADTLSDSVEVEISIDSSMPTIVSSEDSRPEPATPHHETTGSPVPESTVAESATTTASTQSSAPPVVKTYPRRERTPCVRYEPTW